MHVAVLSDKCHARGISLEEEFRGVSNEASADNVEAFVFRSVTRSLSSIVLRVCPVIIKLTRCTKINIKLLRKVDRYGIEISQDLL